MIINFPTGLYSNSIKTSDNVTFVISGLPPRISELFLLQLPNGVALQKRNDRHFTDSQRRVLGTSFITKTFLSGVDDSLTSGKQRVEPGQVLEFEEDQITVEPFSVANVNVIKHDTNKLDKDSLDLDSTVIDKAFDAFKEYSNRLNSLKTQRDKIDSDIRSNQKSINETTKAINSLNSIIDAVGDDDGLLASKIDKLTISLDELKIERAELVATADSLADEAHVIADKLKTVSNLLS